jgi:hypothetical protein
MVVAALEIRSIVDRIGQVAADPAGPERSDMEIRLPALIRAAARLRYLSADRRSAAKRALSAAGTARLRGDGRGYAATLDQALAARRCAAAAARLARGYEREAHAIARASGFLN